MAQLVITITCRCFKTPCTYFVFLHCPEDFYLVKFSCRPQLTCGTHALTVALSAILRPGDELLSPVGRPYDTLEGVIGIKKNKVGTCLYRLSFLNKLPITIINHTYYIRFYRFYKWYQFTSPVGRPYDTLEGVIGIKKNSPPCSLKEYGITYRQADLMPDGSFDYESIRAAINERTKKPC